MHDYERPELALYYCDGDNAVLTDISISSDGATIPVDGRSSLGWELLGEDAKL